MKLAFTQRRVAMRQMGLVGVAVLGMASIPLAAFVADDYFYGDCSGGGVLSYWLGVLLIVVLIGAAGSVPTVPVVVACLWEKDLRIAIPLVYGPSVGLVTAYVRFAPWRMFYPIDATVVGIVAVVVLSVVVMACLPNRIVVAGDANCPKCAYDLRGNLDDGCPECGWGRRTAG